MNLAEIWIYPIKSFGGIASSDWQILDSGPLKHDREWALFDENGKVYNAKRDPAFCGLDLDLTKQGWQVNSLDLGLLVLPNLDEIQSQNLFSEWASEHFEKKLILKQNSASGFPDDIQANGPTLVHRKSLERVAEWFSISYRECLRRFRVNLVIDGEENNFAEDLWVNKLATLDEVELRLTNICKRCVVPTRDSMSGIPTLDFTSIFKDFRLKERPQGVNPEVYNVDYKFCLNSKTIKGGKVFVGQKFEVF